MSIVSIELPVIEGKGQVYEGMNRSSILTNLAMRSVKASPSNSGRAMRLAERFRRRMFLSGRKRRSSSVLVL